MATPRNERTEQYVDVFIPQRGYMRFPLLSWLHLGISAREGHRKAGELFGEDGTGEDAAVERTRRGAVLQGDFGAHWDDGE